MSNKVQRLAALVQELRGSLTQVELGKKLGVDRSTISLWESAHSYPDPENLSKLARLKGWTLEQLEDYLLEGQLPTEDPLEQILRKMQNLPSEAVIQIVSVGAQTLAERMDSTEKLSVKT